jgi:hypothetical protein
MLTIPWLLATDVGKQIINDDTKYRQIAGHLIAMGMRQYNAGCITQWSTSRTSLEATVCHHQVSACAVLHRRQPWLTISEKKHKTLTKIQLLASNNGTNQSLVIYENFVPQNGHSTQLINATSFV